MTKAKWSIAILSLFAVSACKPRTQLMLGVTTNLTAPGQLNRVTLDVFRDGVPFIGPYDWPVPGTRGQIEVLPGSFGLYSSDGSEPRLDIRLTGYIGDVAKVERRAIVPLVGGKTLFMRMSLVYRCDVDAPDNSAMCPDGYTCIEGECKVATVDPKTLPPFQDTLISNLTCNSSQAGDPPFINTETQNPMAMMGNGLCAGICQEGTCNEPVIIPGEAEWAKVNLPDSAKTQSITSVWGTNNGEYTVYSVGTGGTLLRLNSLGMTAAGAPVPEPTSGDNLHSVFGSSATDIWAVGDAILHRNATGWTTTVTNAQLVALGVETLNSVWAKDTSNAWAVGRTSTQQQVVLRWSGTGWTLDPAFEAARVNSPGDMLPGDLKAITGVTGSDGKTTLFAGGLGATFWKYGEDANCKDANMKPIDCWVSPTANLNLSPPPDIHALYADTAAGVLYLAGSTNAASGDTLRGIIFRLNATNLLLSQDATGEFLPFTSIAGTPGGDIYATGEDGTIARSKGDGKWTAQASNVRSNMHGVFPVGAGDIYAVGDKGTILHSSGATTK